MRDKLYDGVHLLLTLLLALLLTLLLLCEPEDSHVLQCHKACDEEATRCVCVCVCVCVMCVCVCV